MQDLFTGLRRRVLLPFHEGIVRRRNVAQYHRFAEQSQWWPRERLLAFQWGELTKLLAHAGAQSPYWRDVLRARGLQRHGIRSYEDFQKLPIIDKLEIRTHREQMVALDHRGRTWLKTTGGSTGEPFHFEYTPESYDWRVAMSRRGYGWAGYEEGMRQVSVWGAFSIGREPLYRRWKEALHRRMAGRVLVNSLKLDSRAMRDCVGTINRHAPVTIVGFTNPLYELARFVNAHGGLRVTPRAVIAAAEKLYDHQRHELEQAFGCPVFETYGNREFMLIGAECDRKTGLHLSVENLFVEIIKEDGTPARAGETGEIVITDLHNYGMPFIRYRSGDMGVASDDACPCGRGLPLLRQVIGRTLDVIRRPDGTVVAGEFFPFLLKSIPGIRQLQVVQGSLDHVTIKVVADDGCADAVVAALRTEMLKMCGETLRLTFELVERIPLTPEGKLRMSISHVRLEPRAVHA